MMADARAGIAGDGEAAAPPTHPTVTLAGSGQIRQDGESSFVTAQGFGAGNPAPCSEMEGTSYPGQTPGDALLASIARIEARQARTEDAMAMLLSARNGKVSRRGPPSPIHFGGFDSNSSSTLGKHTAGY